MPRRRGSRLWTVEVPCPPDGAGVLCGERFGGVRCFSFIGVSLTGYATKPSMVSSLTLKSGSRVMDALVLP